MQAYRLETVISQHGELQLKQLPFHPGELVEVIVLPRRFMKIMTDSFPLKNSVLKFEQPTEPIAEDDWAVMQ
jgi:hypothetical protein